MFKTSLLTFILLSALTAECQTLYTENNLNSPTFVKKITFPDLSSINSSGYFNNSTYSYSNGGASNNPWYFEPILNYGSITSGVYASNFTPTITITGGTNGVFSSNIEPIAGNSSVNFGTFSALNLNIETLAGYSGTITNGRVLQINGGDIFGSNPITNFTEVFTSSSSNGNGITSGNITNSDYIAAAHTAAGGIGSTLKNINFWAQLSSGSSSSTTNYGLYITGNGGTSSSNYSIYSSSTAPSFLTGNLTLSGIYGQTPVTWTDTQTCVTGQISWDANYIYVCTSTNTVKRVALNSF